MFCRSHSMGDGVSQNPKAPRIESSSFKAKAAKELTKTRVGVKALEERFDGDGQRQYRPHNVPRGKGKQLANGLVAVARIRSQTLSA